jgi:hypothetical protein
MSLIRQFLLMLKFLDLGTRQRQNQNPDVLREAPRRGAAADVVQC